MSDRHSKDERKYTKKIELVNPIAYLEMLIPLVDLCHPYLYHHMISTDKGLFMVRANVPELSTTTLRNIRDFP